MILLLKMIRKKNIYDSERKKLLYSQFVLFHLLKRLGHKVNPENFSIIKTADRKKIMMKSVKRFFLGWDGNFQSLDK